MNIIIHSKYLVQYEFLEVLDRVSYNTSVYAIIKNQKVILIDSGYYNYAMQISDDLKKKNLVIDTIIITHYHRDHAEGSVYFGNAKIIASHRYYDNLIKCQKLLKINERYKIPDIVIQESYEFNFEDIIIKVIETPGHTPCSISVVINNKYLYVSDLLLEDIKGKIIVPYIDTNSNVENHLKSLIKLNNLNVDSILFTHGKPRFGLSEFNKNTIFKNRIYYLEKFIESNYSANIEACLLQDLKNYSMTEIHKLNIRNAKKRVSAAHQFFLVNETINGNKLKCSPNQ